ncbi:family 1 glycosylhydrolase [Novosphingobium sp.]|uniref:family 1 glycosylhydrolase n=1 Tax=Novosphingobium sp. TaxID=1874826 RepID=UPI0025D71C1B|nr:family 1 glycosylhydrolase [Novosphingobium sp.]
MVNRRTLIAGSAAGGALALGGWYAARHQPHAFPRGFLWGAATAGHQIEGNNTNADCYLLETVKPTVFPYPSGMAANSFALWAVDLDLAKGLGLNAYRFSLEWARIEPAEGRFSVPMLDHYKAIIEGCRARGLAPVVTFNHFTTPCWFAARGGWLAEGAAELFARFCGRAAQHLGAGIAHAITLNEPNLAGRLQALVPPPFLQGDKAMAEAAARASGTRTFVAGNALYIADPARMQANLLVGHTLARAAIKAVRPELPVGVALALFADEAIGPNSLRDAKQHEWYGAWLDLARHDDFVGVQNYERWRWDDKGRVKPPHFSSFNTMGSEIYPPSLANAVRYAHAVTRRPVLITEHGLCTDRDALRASFISAALAELGRAIADGVPVLGYMHWSLIDTYEWIFGYRNVFGLHSVDRQTFARTARPSAAVYARIAQANAA